MKRKFILLFIVLTSIQLKSEVLSVSEITQEQNEWCWAGVSACILDYYCKPTQQCTIAEYTRSVATWHDFGDSNCCDNPDFGCNYWNYNYGSSGSIQSILVNFGNITNQGVGSSLTESQVTSDIQNKRPFVIRWGWSGGGGHFIVGHGLEGSSLYYMDPWYGEGLKVASYSWVVSGNNHTWTHTNRMTVSPTIPANAGTIIGSTNVCQGQNSVKYSVPEIANATSYSWTLPNGATGTSTTNSITVDYGHSFTSGDIKVKGVNSCGEGTTSSLSIMKKPLPLAAGIISGETTVCQGQNSVTYTVPEIDNATSYAWTLPNGATGTSKANSITVNYGTSAKSGDIKVKGVNSCGEGSLSALSVAVNPLPVPAEIISGSTSVCQGQKSVTYTIPEIAYATSYSWTLSNDATGTSKTNSITVDYGTSAKSGEIRVKGVNPCGDGAESTLLVQVTPTPDNPNTITGLTSVCQGQNSVTYTVPEIANATSYIWTLPNGAIGTSKTNSITVNYGTSATSGNITVKGNNSCGDGAVSTLPITVNPLPATAATISGNTTVCQGQNSVIYTIPTITNASSYIWTLPTGAIGSSTTNSITVNYDNSATSGNITVKGNNSCGDGAVSTLPITVNIKPATPIISLNGLVLQSDAPIGNQWYDQNGLIKGAINQNYNVSVDGDYYVIVTLLGCNSDSSNTINVSVTSIEVADADKIIKVYPNPVSNELVLEIEGNKEKVNFEILNAIGQIVFKGNLAGKTTVQTSNFAPGVYLIKIENGKTFEYKKILIK